MIQIIKCETADSGHRTVALTVCLEIMRTLLQGLQEVENEGEGGSRNLNLEKNNHLCTFCAKFLDDFTLLDTPSCVQLSVLSSVSTHTTHGQRTTNIQKIKKGVVESLLKSGSGSAGGSERENMNVGENVNVSVGSSSGSERDNEAIRLWLLSCDTDVISNALSQIHSNTNTNTNTNFNSNSNTNSNTNSSLYSNSNDQNHISRSPLTSRNSSFIDGNINNNNNNNNNNSMAEKLIETRSRSHILLLLPIISSIVCFDNNSNSNNNNSNNNGNNNNNSNNNNSNNSNFDNPFHNIDRDIDRDIHHNNSVCTGGRLVRASACRAIARVDMTALMDSFSSLEETNKKLLQENMRLRAQIESINSTAGGLPF